MASKRKAPKMGTQYKEIVALGCLFEDGDCGHGYDWSCDHCPCTIEKNKYEQAKELSEGKHEITCKSCGRTQIAAEGFYRDHVGRFGFYHWSNVCRSCRSKQNYTRELERKTKFVPTKDILQLNRSTEKGFRYYMLNNPHYFTSIFSKACNEQNIKEEWENLKL